MLCGEGLTPLLELEWWRTIDFECAGERMGMGLCYNTDLMATQCKNRSCAEVLTATNAVIAVMSAVSAQSAPGK